MTREAVVLGQVLRRLRNERKLSQEDVAYESGVDRSFLSEIERGIHQPTVSTLFRIARALGFSVTSIMAEVEEVLSAEEDEKARR